MDEDTVSLLILGGLFVTVLSIPLLVTACVAWGNTRKWAVERRQSVKLPLTASKTTGDIEEASESLINEDSDNESDQEFLDEEDEQYYSKKKARKNQEREERQQDLALSVRAKFLKEWKKCWTGPGGNLEERKKEQEFREEEGRRKVAREAVREYLRLQRRKERKAAMKEVLPSYEKQE